MSGSHGGLARDALEAALSTALDAPLLGTFCTDLRSTPCDTPIDIHALGMPSQPSAEALQLLAATDVGVALCALRQANRDGVGHVDVNITDETSARVTVIDLSASSGVHAWIIAEQGSDIEDRQFGVRHAVRSFTIERNRLAEFVDVADGVTALLGWEPADLLGHTALDFVHPGDRERSIDAWVDVIERCAASHNRCRWRAKDGSWRWVEVISEVVDHDVVVSRVVDVQAEMDALAEAKLGQEGFATLTAALPIGVAQFGLDGGLVYANEALLELKERLNSTEGLSDFLTATGCNPVVEKAVVAALNGDSTDTLLTLRTDSAIHSIQLRARPLTVDGERAGAMATFDDVSEAKALEHELHVRATVDPLTGVANRASTLEQLDATVALTEGGAGPAAVLFIDLDHFKHVNDSMGHLAGDDLLVAISDRITTTVRSADFVGRLGGDEFLVICPNVDTENDARRLATRIQRAMVDPFVIAGRTIRTSLSVGVALTEPGLSATELLAAADAAVYEAKGMGRNAVYMFDQAMRHRSTERLELTSALQDCLDRPGEICAHFQPVVDLATSKIVAFEALARWRHPTRGLLPAGVFIDLAEDVGLEVPIGWQVLEDAAAFARECRPLSCDDAPIGVNVNVSVRQLNDPDVVDRIADVIDRAGADPSQLCIEVTERTLVADIESASATLSALRRLGLKTAIDDFGTGHSSLSYLRTLPFDTIKIDMSFTRTLLEGDDSMAIVGGVIRMCQAMDREIIAEGIESREQMAALHGLRCPLGQGYLFAPALEPTTALELLRSGLTTRVDTSR